MHTSDRVAPPITNTKIRWPIFLKSLEVCLNTESLQEEANILSRRPQQPETEQIVAQLIWQPLSHAKYIMKMMQHKP